MLSQTAEYALRAVLYLAQRQDPRPVHVGEVARALEIPQNYLAKTLHTLARGGVLASARGRTGGFRLAVPAARLPLAAVVAPFDRLAERGRCLLGRPRCGENGTCAAHTEWRGVAEHVADFFHQTTVADLLRHEEVVAHAEPNG